MKMLILLAIATSSLNAEVRPDAVIYGDDNRLEVHKASPMQKEWARSAATMVGVDKISTNKDGSVSLSQDTLKGWLESIVNPKSKSPTPTKQITFCSDELFVEQPNAGMCSGFLIAPDLVVTAGHCVELENFCEGYRWVFDYKVNAQTGKAGINLPAKDIYHCKRAVTNALNLELGVDFAIIQLDRPVEGRKPLEIRSEGSVSKEASLVVIGNPSGLPLKVAADAKVRDNSHPFYFKTNLDTYQGNSGSAVFNNETGVIEGILVRGEEDYRFNSEKGCIESNRCSDDECRGEDVTRMNSIPEVALKKSLDLAAESGDMETLEKILELRIWVDYYGPDKVTALMKAASKGMSGTMAQLLAKNAEINLTDLNGNSALHYLAQNEEASSSAFELLLAGNPNFELKNFRGETPLLIAAKTNNVAALKLMIAAGANINALNLRGENALYAAINNRSTEAVQVLVDAGINTKIRNKYGVDPVLLTYLKKFKSGRVLIKSSLRALSSNH